MDSETPQGPGIVGRLVIEMEEAESTNDLVRQYGETGETEGLVVTATRQTRGRGRGGNRWFTPTEGGLALSILLRPIRSESALTLLPLVAALATAEAIEALCNVAPEIKWPNDVLTGGRKVGGILCETFGRGDSLFVVVGLGVNVNFTAFDFPRELRRQATTLSDLSGGAVELRPLLDGILRRLDRDYGLIRAGRTDDLLDRVRARMPMLGRRVEVETPGGLVAGKAVALLPGGELQIEGDGQERITVVSGHVTRYT